MPGHNSILVNEPDFEISVSSTHTLDDGKTENTIPRLVDSQHICSVHFSFSGTVDHSTSISPSDMLRSYVVQSFRNYLTLARSPFAHDFFILTDFAPPKNGKRLGLVDISEAILDDHYQASGVSGVSSVPKGS